jgi:Fe2+ transport system protein FeoA
MKLSATLKSKTVVVEKVNITDQHILHKINNIGITNGTIIKVLDYDNSDKILHLLIYGVEYVLREEDCRQINVREYQDNKSFHSKR